MRVQDGLALKVGLTTTRLAATGVRKWVRPNSYVTGEIRGMLAGGGERGWRSVDDDGQGTRDDGGRMTNGGWKMVVGRDWEGGGQKVFWETMVGEGLV